MTIDTELERRIGRHACDKINWCHERLTCVPHDGPNLLIKACPLPQHRLRWPYQYIPLCAVSQVAEGRH